ncbi:MAG: virulence factor family protein [Labrys sp. (in: a-proteobacteria)]
MLIRPLTLALCLLGSTIVPGLAAPRTVTVDNGTFGSVAVLAPAEEPTAFIAVVADTSGFTGDRTAEAEQLVARGAAVLVLDPSTVVQKLDASGEKDCHYFLGGIEDISHSAQRALGSRTYRWPVVLGAGPTGGLLAYLAIAQAPDNTAAGAVASGLTTRLKSRLPFCAGAPWKADTAGGFAYGTPPGLPGSFALITDAAPEDATTALTGVDATRVTVAVEADPKARFDAIIEAAFKAGATKEGDLADLPLVELPATGTPKALVVFYSGDGGWRDIDKSIAEALAAKGIGVVGVDSLRYFWEQKSPEAIAADLDRIIGHYQEAWQVKPVVLAGYSFGAGILPFAYPVTAPKTQSSTRLIAMLGLDPMSSFEISVGGFVGFGSSTDQDVRPALARLPLDKTMCFYGAEEKASNDTACTAPELSKATLVERPGGHHFDGDYQSIADILLKRIEGS